MCRRRCRLLMLLATEQPAIYGHGSVRLMPPDATAHQASNRLVQGIAAARRPEAANGLTSVISRDASVRTKRRRVVNSVGRSAPCPILISATNATPPLRCPAARPPRRICILILFIPVAVVANISMLQLSLPRL